jgi:hypothetical protein
MRSTFIAILSSQSKKARPPVFHYQQLDDSKDHEATGIRVADRMSAREQPVSSHRRICLRDDFVMTAPFDLVMCHHELVLDRRR